MIKPAELPIMRVAGEVLAGLMPAGSRMVLSAPTGSGKTTQIPRILLEALAKSAPHALGRVIVLQPRRLAARSVAARVAKEMGCALGSTVGFETRVERKVSSESRLIFQTDGLFLRRLLTPSGLKGVAAVVIDEFHERSTASDMVAGLVRQAQERGADVRLLAMSATVDAQRLAAALGAKSVIAEGRLHPVDIRYWGDIPKVVGGRRGPAVWDVAAAALSEMISSGQQGDALLFMPGKFEIGRCIEAIQGKLRAIGETAEVFPLHGSLEPEAQDRALAPCRQRKIVVATNIAETSITIDGIRLVIDSGLARVARHDPLRDLNVLRLETISMASASQRTGRAGRTAPGVCVRLWSESAHAKLSTHDEPEIHRVELSEALLSVMAAGQGDLAAFPWIDQPHPKAVAHAMEVLRATGAINADASLTAEGREMAGMPVHPRLARAMLESREGGCVEECARMCAAVVAGNLLSGEQALDQLLKGETPCDLLIRSRVLEAFMRGAAPRGADLDACREATRTAADLVRNCTGGESRSGGGNGGRSGSRGGAAGERAAQGSQTVRTISPVRCLLRAYPDRVAWRIDPNKDTVLMPGRRKTLLDRGSVVRASGPLLALEIREAPDLSRSLITLAASLQEAWVEEDCADQFSKKVTERWEPSSRSVIEAEETSFGSVLLRVTERPPRDAEAAAAVLAEKWGQGEIAPESWNEDVRQWIERVRCCANWSPNLGLPMFDDEEMAVLRLEISSGCLRAKDLDAVDCLSAVRGALSHQERGTVDRLAPASITLPSGRKMRLDYTVGKPPRGASRIQDFYGLDRTPAVCGGKVPVVLEILGPNNRPLQVTQDLAEFWRTLYPQLRPELKRRYPRHDWR